MKKSNIIMGSIIIILGLILAGNQLGFWQLYLFFDGWWAFIIIIPSIVGLLKKQWISGVFGLFLGVVLFFTANGIIDKLLIAPLFLIIIGVVIILPKHNKLSENTKKEYVSMFSINEHKLLSLPESISASAIFGGIDLDLTGATIGKDVIIDCICLFGGINIIVDKNVQVEVKGFPIFGGIKNRSTPNSKTKILIKSISVFGGINIK